MKKFLTIISIICFAISAFTQPPEKMNYQAVIRNSNNELITNQEVTIKINIRQNAADGIVVYTETQSVTTNANGLVTMEIGNDPGFGNINWSNGNYYIQIEADPTGGTNYTISGVSQLLSVPYALHSKTTSQSLTETDPVFGSSAAFGISTTDISYWNEAFSWGNHASAGYLTAFTESDPLFTSSPSFIITENKISNWDSAYSWGNHAEMGYLTSVSAESDPIFSASDAYGITASDISLWTSAYNWGDHSTAGYLTSFTETDPDFNASAASGISSTNISNWNTAYGWGNHATEGYLTSFTESDPIFGASAASGISSTNISNWNTAYSWGNHATQGYLTSFSETDPYSVHLTGNQSISGEKTFNSRTNILQIEVSPVNTGNRYGYIDFHGDNTYTDYALRLIRNNTGVNAESWLKHRGTGALYLSADDAGKIGFRTAGSTRMYIDSNGEIGVGTTAPGAKFEVNSAGYTGAILFQVKDNAGNPVFTVYPDAVEVSVPDDGTKASKHGAFIISGRDTKGDKASLPITRITKQNYLIGHNVATNIQSTSYRNSIIGYEAGKAITYADDNIFLGYYAGYSNRLGNNNIFIGIDAGRQHNPLNSSEGSDNVYVGNKAGYLGTTGDLNVLIGNEAGYTNNNNMMTAVGYKAGYASNALFQVFMGAYSGVSATGMGSTFIGYASGYHTTSGAYNTFLGNSAGAKNTTGSQNTIVGNNAGGGVSVTNSFSNNVLIGYTAGYSDQSIGSSNVMIGSYSGRKSSSSNGTGNVFIGYQSGRNETGSNKLYIENSSSTTPLIYGDFSSDYIRINGRLGVYANYGDYCGIFVNDGNSVYRYGISIQTGTDNNSGTNYMVRFADGDNTPVGYITSSGGYISYGTKSFSPGKTNASKFDKNANRIINGIDIVYFNPSKELDNTIVGFNGKQLMELFPGSTFYNDETNEYYTDKSFLIPILTKAIQEQQQKITEMEKELTKVDQLQMEIENLKQKINQLLK